MNEQVIHCDVAVVGGGPAGLSAATQLRRRGVERVMVLEREPVAGGIPRHCGHPPFGWREFHRILKGPEYALRLREAAVAAGVEVLTRFTVISLRRGPVLRVSTPAGLAQVDAKRVLLATGVRETPRSTRMISGTRPLGVLTTGALQSMVYLKSRIPFLRPLIVGTEWVSFSALLTCRHAGIRPVAMIEEQHRPTVGWAAAGYPMLRGIRLLTKTELLSIDGKHRVNRVVVRHQSGRAEQITCDGVVFSGQFVPESGLVRTGHLEVNTTLGNPLTDQFGRCSDRDFFAAGNMLHPADSSGRCWRDGVQTAENIIHSLTDDLPASSAPAQVLPMSSIIRYTVPQRLILDHRSGVDVPLQVRFSGESRGILRLWADQAPILAKSVRARPEKQVVLSVPNHILPPAAETLSLTFDRF